MNAVAGVDDVGHADQAPLKVRQWHIHPGWDRFTPQNNVTHGHDLAIIELGENDQSQSWAWCTLGSESLNHKPFTTSIFADEDIIFTDRVQPACLPEPDCNVLTQPGRPVQVNGFGANNYTQYGSRYGARNIFGRGYNVVPTSLHCYSHPIFRPDYELPDYLQHGDLAMISEDSCRQSFRIQTTNESLIVGDQICALGNPKM